MADEQAVETPEAQFQEESPAILPGLFDDESEAMTEEQLSGDSEEAEPEPEKEVESDQSSTKTEPVDPKEPEDAAKKEGEGQESDKPPAGFVPKQALDEERHRRQSLSSELYQTKQQLEAIKKQQGPSPETETADEFKDFKVLSTKEVDELIDDDPFEGTKYLHKLDRYKDYQRQQSEQESKKQESEFMRQQVIKDCVDEIDRVAPGIWDAGSNVGKELTDTAEKFGVSRQVAGVLSNPGTIIIDQETGQQMILGSGAAEFVRLVKGLADHSKNSDPESVRKSIEKEVTERVTKELTRKFKTGSTGVISLGDASSHSEGVSGAIPNSEEEWARLSDDDRRRALGG